MGTVLRKTSRAFAKVYRLTAFGLANAIPRFSPRNPIRIELFRRAGMKISEGVVIWGPVTAVPLEGLGNISIGAASFLNTETRFGCPEASISIGERVQVGPRVSFESVNHGPAREDGKNGRVVWSDEEFIDAVASLTRDRRKLDSMGAESARMAVKWSWEIVAEKWLAQLNHCIGLQK